MAAVSANVRLGCGPASHQTTNVTAAATRTTGMNTSAMRSARRAIGAFEPCARWTRSTIRASAVSRPTRVARMTKLPVRLSDAPMTSSPGPTSTGIGSPVSIDVSTLEPPSTTDPSTGIGVAGPDPQEVADRDRLERDLAVLGPSTTRRAVFGLNPMRRRIGTGRPDLRPGLEPAAQQDEADDDRRRIEVGDGLDAGVHDDLRPERHDHAVAPRRGRADRDQRVHVGRPVARRPPRRPVEATAGPDLDERRRDEREAVELGHPERRRRAEHQDHDPERDGDRDGGGDQEAPRLALAFEVVLRDLVGERRRGCVGVGRPAAVRARRSRRIRWRRRGLLRSAIVGQVADGRHLGREVDRRRLDAGRLPQEALDAIDARRAGHPLDRERQLGGGARASVILPGSISPALLCETREVTDPRAIYRSIPGPWGPFFVAATERGVVAVDWLTTEDAFRDSTRPPSRRPDRARPTSSTRTTCAPRHLDVATAALEALLAGRPADATVTLDLHGPPGLGPPRPRRGRAHPLRLDRELRRHRPAGRRAAGRACRRWRGRSQPDRPAHPVPPGHRRGRHHRRLRWRCLGQPRGPPRHQARPPRARRRRGRARLGAEGCPIA